MIAAPEHIGCIVADFDETMHELSRLGHRWSRVITPETRIRRQGSLEVTTVRYVVTSGGLPRIKLIEEIPGSYWTPDAGTSVHHLTYWVDDLERESERLVAGGATIDADGLDPNESLRYQYLRLASGVRIELSRIALRNEFEDWATA